MSADPLCWRADGTLAITEPSNLPQQTHRNPIGRCCGDQLAAHPHSSDMGTGLVSQALRLLFRLPSSQLGGLNSSLLPKPFLGFPVARCQSREARSADYLAVSPHSAPPLTRELRQPPFCRLRICFVWFFFPSCK